MGNKRVASSNLAMPLGVSQWVKRSAARTDGRKELGMMRSCSLDGNLGRLWAASGCGRGGKTNETTPPEDVEARAWARASARDLGIL